MSSPVLSVKPTDAQRMRRIPQVHTKPELAARRLLSGLGYRYRLHRRDLPGRPDIVFPGRQKVVFIHGCFWHGHDCSWGKNQPNTNQEFWRNKLMGNIERDK